MAFCGTINTTIERVAYRPLAQRAAARAADHRDRDVVHPPEHRPRLEGRATDLACRTSCRTATSSRSAASPTRGTSSSSLLFTVPVLLALDVARPAHAAGKAMRATAQDRDAAAMMGIDVNRTISFTFLLAGCARRRGRPPLRALLHEHPLRPGLPARADRVHRRGARRHRQPARRRARRARDRASSRRSTTGSAGTRRGATGPSRSSSRS